MRKFFLIFCLSMMLSNSAFSSELIIEAQVKINVGFTSKEIIVGGKYAIRNSGESLAYNVYPTFKLGKAELTQIPFDIPSNDQHVWTIYQTVPIAKLDCSEDDSCAGLSLPMLGKHTLLGMRHYQDSVGKNFSGPDLIQFIIGDNRRSSLENPAIQASISVNQSSFGYYDTEVTIYNYSKIDKEVAVSVHGSQEFSIEAAKPVKLLAGGSRVVRFKVLNSDAPIGSIYPIFAVLQWEEDGLRNASYALTNVIVEKENYSAYYILAAVILELVFLVWYLVSKRLVKKARELDKRDSVP